MSSSGELSTEAPTPNRLLLYFPTAWDGSNNKGTQKQQKISCECFYDDCSKDEQSLPVALYPYQESVISTLPLSLRLEILISRAPLLLKHTSKLPMDLFTNNSAILLSTNNTHTTDKTPKFVLLLPMSFNCSLLYPITKTTLLHNLQQLSLQGLVHKNKKYSRNRFLPAVSSATAPSQQDWKSLLLDEDCIKTNQPDCISSEVDQKPTRSSRTVGPTENVVTVVQQQPTETTEALPLLDHYYNNCIFHEDILLLPTSSVADTITHFATALLPNKIRAIVASKDTTSISGSSAEYWFQNCDFIQEMYIPHRILHTCFQTKELPQSIKLRMQQEKEDVRLILFRVLALQIMIRLQITSIFEIFHKDDYFMKDFTNTTTGEKAKKQLKKKRQLDTSATKTTNSQQQQISGAIIKLLSHAPFLLPPDITFTDFLAWTVGLPYLSSNISWIVSDIYAQFELDPPSSKEPQTEEQKKKKKARVTPKKTRDPKSESKQQSRASVSTVTSTAAVTSNKFLKGSKASYGQKVGSHFSSKLLKMHHHPLLLSFDGNTSASRGKCNKNMNTNGSNKENKLSSQWQPMHSKIDVGNMNGREILIVETPQKNEWMVEETPMKTSGRLASSFVADAAAAARRESRAGN